MDANELLDGAITDWGGFEKFVAELNRTSTDVRVEHNVTLVDRAGVKRQMDVVIRHKQGLIEHLDICECKFWRRNVNREKVDAFVTSVRELRASRGIMFSAKGFQSGAIEAAEANGILLYKVREPTVGEWGHPGRIVDIFLTGASRAIGPLTFTHAIGTDATADPNVNFDLRIGDNVRENIVNIGTNVEQTSLEALFKRSSLNAGSIILKQQYTTRQPLFDGGDGQRRIRTTAALVCPEGIIPASRPDIRIFTVQYALGVSINQKRLIIDRAKNYSFAVAIEDCVTNTVTGAFRKVSDMFTQLAAWQESVPTTDTQIH